MLELCNCYFAIARALGICIDRINSFESIVCPVYTYVGREFVPCNSLATLVDKSELRYRLPGVSVQELFEISPNEWLELDVSDVRSGWLIFMRP